VGHININHGKAAVAILMAIGVFFLLRDLFGFPSVIAQSAAILAAQALFLFFKSKQPNKPR
jgi:hypothetical protein